MSLLSNLALFKGLKQLWQHARGCNQQQVLSVLTVNTHSTSKAAVIASDVSFEISHLVGSCTARWGEMLQARFTLSFHCFSLRLMYLDLQFATLLSPVWSNSSSGEDSGLYHVIKRSISVAWGKQEKKGFLEEAKHSQSHSLVYISRVLEIHAVFPSFWWLTSSESSNVLRFM